MFGIEFVTFTMMETEGFGVSPFNLNVHFARRLRFRDLNMERESGIYSDDDQKRIKVRS